MDMVLVARYQYHSLFFCEYYTRLGKMKVIPDFMKPSFLCYRIGSSHSLAELVQGKALGRSDRCPPANETEPGFG